MKVTDIIPDDRDYRTTRVAIHLKKKKKTNPKASKGGTLKDFIDVFGGVSGGGSGGSTSEPQGTIV